MIAGIVATERRTVFHIDPDHAWVKHEWEAFERETPGRYRFFRPRPAERRILKAATGGKLIVHWRSRNRFVTYECRGKPDELKRLEEAHLIASEADGSGFRLTRFGQVFSDHLNQVFEEGAENHA